MTRLKAVIHVHTNYSHDSNAAPADVLELARAQGVHVVTITDHDEIDGALETQALARSPGDVRVIAGEEITSADGHIIGLFLRERIPPGLPGVETAQRIKAQGGLVLAPHPYTVLCDGSLGEHAMTALLPWLDGVEVCNAQDPLSWENAWADRFAATHHVTPYCGADAHLRGYLAGCYQWIGDYYDPPTFLAALRQAELVRGWFGWGYVARMGFRHVWDMISPVPLPGYATNLIALRRARRNCVQS